MKKAEKGSLTRLHGCTAVGVVVDVVVTDEPGPEALGKRHLPQGQDSNAVGGFQAMVDAASEPGPQAAKQVTCIHISYIHKHILCNNI